MYTSSFDLGYFGHDLHTDKGAAVGDGPKSNKYRITISVARCCCQDCATDQHATELEKGAGARVKPRHVRSRSTS